MDEAIGEEVDVTRTQGRDHCVLKSHLPQEFRSASGVATLMRTGDVAETTRCRRLVSEGDADGDPATVDFAAMVDIVAGPLATEWATMQVLATALLLADTERVVEAEVWADDLTAGVYDPVVSQEFPTYLDVNERELLVIY